MRDKYKDPEDQYQGYDGYSNEEEQLAIAVRALHVIAVMGTLNDKNVSEIAMDALKEMETYGQIYQYYE
jgi:hypothetical protein